MRAVPLFIIMFVLMVGCTTTGTTRGGASTAEIQAELSTDPAQAELWREAVKNDAVSGIENAFVEGPVVKERKIVWVADRQVKSKRIKIPEAVHSSVRVLATPEFKEEFTDTVRVKSVDGEFLVLDLGKGRTLNLQTKVRGERLRARVGEMARIQLRQGEPFRRNDLVALKLPEDDLIYALVGSKEPVHLKVDIHSLSAKQIGKSEQNSMSVQVVIGGESRILKQGQQADFQQSKLTVKIVASIAVLGEAANVLPGQPYRLELIGWRTAGK